jgi:hypothetical protein
MKHTMRVDLSRLIMVRAYEMIVWPAMPTSSTLMCSHVDLSRSITGTDGIRFLQAPTWLGLNPQSGGTETESLPSVPSM